MTQPILIFFFAWAVPGAGHFVLGQRWRGAAFFLAIAATFAFGLYVTEGRAVSPGEHRLAFFAQVFAGLPFLGGYGLDLARKSLTQGAGASFGSRGLPNEIIAAIDLGLVFTMVAGLLNLLLALDATDRANARRETPGEARP